MDRDERARMFEELVAEHGKDWKKIAEVLNKLGVRTPRGSVWTRDGARNFHRSLVTKNRVTYPPEEATSPIITHQLPEWLDADAWQDLHDMLQSWKIKRKEDMVESQYRPMFRGKRRNSGIHVNEIILRRAMKKAKLEKARTGGSLSRLVEFLLWQYLGAPADVLEPLSPHRDPGGAEQRE